MSWLYGSLNKSLLPYTCNINSEFLSSILSILIYVVICLLVWAYTCVSAATRISQFFELEVRCALSGCCRGSSPLMYSDHPVGGKKSLRARFRSPTYFVPFISCLHRAIYQNHCCFCLDLSLAVHSVQYKGLTLWLIVRAPICHLSL